MVLTAFCCQNLDKLGGPYYDRNIWSHRAPINGIIYTGFTGVPNEAVISVELVVSPHPKMLQWNDIFYLHEWLNHVGKEFQSHPVPYGLPIGLAPSLVASDPLYCGQDGCRVRNPRISAVGLALKEKATDSNPKILGLAPKPKVSNLVFRWPKPLFFHGFWGLMVYNLARLHNAFEAGFESTMW